MSCRIKMNWPEAEIAFERNAVGLRSYVEKATGQILVVIETDPQDAEPLKRIAANPDDFLRLDPASSQEQYRWMEQFVTTIEPGELRDKLLLGIDGRGAFRRFKDLLLGYPVERDRWFVYRGELLHHYINKWLVAKGIETDPPPPWGEAKLPADPVVAIAHTASSGDNPADQLRRQIKSLVDTLSAGDLQAARVFLEYLRDRGSAELTDTRGKTDFRRPLRRPSTQGPSLFLHESDRQESDRHDADKHDSDRAVDEGELPHDDERALKVAGKL